MSKTVHLIRHGQSTFNAYMSLHGRDPMYFDAPLSPLGQQQADDLADQVRDMDIGLVVTTPFTRAIQTARAGFREKRDVPMLVNPYHRELLAASCDVGRSPTLLASEFPDLDFTALTDPWWHVQPDHPGPFSQEPEDDFMDRLLRFKGWIANRPESEIAVVGHGMFFYHLTGTFLENAELMTIRM